MPLRRFFQTDIGFTLVEVMVALTIMSVVVVIAFSGLSIGLNSWERGSREIDDLDRRATVERLLKRQLAGASPMELKIDEKNVSLFRGSSDRVEFVTDYSLAEGATDFKKIDYTVEDGRFLYSEKPIFGYVPGASDEVPPVELAQFRRISFKFLGYAQDGSPVWADEWSMGLPLAVQAQIDDDVVVIRLINR